MNINESVGVIHDAIFYNVIFFSRKNIFARPVGLDFYQQEVQLPHYDELKTSKHLPDPPDTFYPFFYFDGIKSCAVTAYLGKYCNGFQLTTETFFSNLLDKSKFKKFVMAYYFADSLNEKELQSLCLANGETVAKALSILSEDRPIKYFTHMFFHFSQLVDQMIELFHQLIPIIEAYHFKHKKDTLNILQKFVSIDNQRLVKKSVLISDVNTIDLDRQIYAICYLNQSIVKSFSQGDKYIFILGCDWAAYLAHAIDYSHVTMQSIMASMGHSTKIEIIDELRKKDLTISQLAQHLQLARTSISRYIVDLLDELVIIKARNSGPEIYYRLNPIYFQNAKRTIDQYLDETILDINKLL